jgi:endonuclease/exonuclease/phosphatase family metal-dependent hydrolase
MKYPETPLIVAGDLNQTLGGSRRYGSPETRDALSRALSDADLNCQTAGDEPTGQLRHIHLVDHICVTNHLNAGGTYNVWGPKTADGLSMSDHAGLAIDFTRTDRFSADQAATAERN